MKGKIVKNISNLYVVESNNVRYNTKPRGIFRKDNIIPLVGDNVIFDNETITEILPRKNSLVRPPLSNIDQVMIITSTSKPNLSLFLLDKFIAIIEFNNIEPIICFTKLDLLDSKEKEEIKRIRKYYESISYKVFFNTEIDEIKATFKDKLTVFAGQTGSGKSTLLNKLDSSLNLKTDEISIALGRGKHTTRHTELYKIGDGLVSDTPGFSALDLIGMDKTAIRDSFIEFNSYLCKYRDCMHLDEDGCIIKSKVEDGLIRRSRYDNYKKMIEKK